MQNINDLIHEIMLEAEQEIPPFPNHWWSEPLHKAHFIVKYWEMVLSFNQNNINRTVQLENLEEEIGPEEDIYNGDKEKTSFWQLLRAKKEIQKRRNNSRIIREEWQERLTEESKENNPTATKAMILRSMKHREATNRMWQTMK
eukprot:15364866-Ditylum_brightwellii.AAC.1